MRSKKIPSQKNIYHIMHIDKKAVEVDETGHCKVFLPSFMPYHLYLEEEDNLDTLVNNVTNFYYWCSTRLLTLFGAYLTQKEAAIRAVKEIGLNQIKEVEHDLFAALPQYYEMFMERLMLLKHMDQS